MRELLPGRADRAPAAATPSAAFSVRARRLTGTLACLGAFAAAAVAAPAAQADSVVYLKGGNVWIAAPDGSRARQLTLHQYGWSSPSEADDGTIVAAGGLQRVNPGGTDSDGSDQLYRFHPDGNQIGGPIPTYGSYSTPSCPAYPPSRVRVSPDATRIAYGIYACGDFGHMVALWTPSSATGLSFPDQTQGQVDFMNPAWIDSSTFTVSHNGPPVFGAHWGVHSVEAPDNTGPGWFDSHSPMDNMTADAVISRSGQEAVVFFNDAHDWTDGRPRNVRLVVYSNPSMPSDFSGAFGDPVCNVALDASQISDVLRLSPSLSPDGTKVLWGDDRGVEIASLDNPSNCASIAPRLLIPGASQPFYAKGDERAPAANPVQPGVNPAPKPTVIRPANTKKPRITRSGKYLACTTGTWSHHPVRYAYRWTISGKAKGPSGRRLAITRARRGRTVRCRVTASNAAGRATATSLAFRMR
jgi:hypothetical protein